MFDSSDVYFSFLAGQRGKTFYVYPYVGNSGDSLIRMGTIRLLADLGIRSTLNPMEANVILWPGGNPTMWKANVCGWQTVLEKYAHAEFVVGPATFQYSGYDWVSVLRSQTGGVKALFARDPASYRNLMSASLPDSIMIGLSHDPALYLRGSDWLERYRAAATREYVLAAFRVDHENSASPRWGRVLARVFLPGSLRSRLNARRYLRSQQVKTREAAKRAAPGYPLRIADVALYDFDSFVDAVLRAAEVHTDRLHTMLLAALLGKRVYAYSTAYGKLEAVYEHSLKGWAHVDFVSDAEVPEDAGGDGSSARI
jgi:exopolysaccharide biosynthesis predicted pyruvyltransferase EpsI